MNNFGKWILSGGLALAGITAPMAVAFDEPGFYVGAHFGSASAGDWCGEANNIGINPVIGNTGLIAPADAATPTAISFAGLPTTAATLDGMAAHVTKGTSSTANENLRLFADSTFSRTAAAMHDDGVSTSAACGEDSGTSSGIFVGYRMNSNFAFEFATNSGVSTDSMITSMFSTNPGVTMATARIVTTDGGVDTQPTTLNAANTVTRVLAHTRDKTDYTYNISSEGETSGMVISALGFLPIGSGWQVYGRLGLNMWDGSTDYMATLSRGTPGGTATAAYTAYRGVDASVGANAIDAGDADTTLLGSTIPSTVSAGNNSLTTTGTAGANETMTLNGVINGNLAGLGAHDNLYFTGLTPNTATQLAGTSGVQNADGDAVATSTTWKEESSGTGIVIGVGVEWIMSETLGLRAEYTQYGADDGYDLDGLFLSAIWKF